MNKVIVVTGGSAGLGLAIAKAFANRGAIAVLLSRDESRLKQRVAETPINKGRLDWIACDVTSDQSVADAVNEIVGRHHRIDVWVNNVGKSTRIKFDDCSVDHYKQLMESNLYTAIRCARAILPRLEQSSGQLVNIGSLASKTGWANIAPYTVSKSALATFSHQVRVEGPANVNCLLVCPGPIARDDANSRYDLEAEGLDESARRPGAGVKLKGIPPEKLAEKIVSACEKRKKEIVVPAKARILFSISQLSPSLGDWLLKRFGSKG